MNASREKIAAARCWTIKIGSSLLTDNGCGLRRDTLGFWVQQIMVLRAQGCKIVVVSSGAVAEGVSRLGWQRAGLSLHQLQVAAAVGQMGLAQAWESCFREHGVHTAQVLLTHDDMADRHRYLNARNSLRTILQCDVVPVVNENDAVATDEIRFGDNDTLGALVANLIDAEALAILTDQHGLYDDDPCSNSDAQLIGEAQAGDTRLDAYAGTGSLLGRGGMRTKLRAARIAAQSGTNTLIASGMEKDILLRLAAGEDLGTCLWAGRSRIAARKQWLAGQSRVRGKLILDAGALKAIVQDGKSLLAIGVTSMQGEFKRGDIVSCLDRQGGEAARGLINYPYSETERIIGKHSAEIAGILGVEGVTELIHRDNMVILSEGWR
ncbi:MAG: glutamate 5-kinase [Candidatus Eutrophobiaceae bacterium]